MPDEAHGFDLPLIIALLAAAVVAVPLFKRLGLGSILGYLAAGVVIGPFGVALFTDPLAIIHVAELGVVMFLFIIGLEMQPARLWAMRGEIFGLGTLQVTVGITVLTIAGLTLGLQPLIAFIAGTGFVLTSTAIIFQMLEERGELATPRGRRMIAILLLEDLAIVPLLALVAFLATGAENVSPAERATDIAIALGAILALIAAGRWLLNPLFSLLAAAKAREVMTAAALLVVLGSALALELGGLSMAMGAFLAGVLLSGSSFRHQLEADIEPFRGVLLGLFFLGVGMALDLTVIADNWTLIAISVTVYMILKAGLIYAVARTFGAEHRESLERAVLMAQGGEFAFVLYAAAFGVGLIDAEANAVMTATVIVSMALTPIMVILHDRLLPKPADSTEGVESPGGLAGNVLIVGFGRFGQIASQPILARGHSISIIDTSTEAIRDASAFSFKVYYGDGARLDILHAAGAEHARAILVCVNDPEVATRIVELVKAEFPLVRVLSRARDREHAIELIQAGADYQIRETLESAMTLGARALDILGEEPQVVTEIIQDARRRDAQRLDVEVVDGIYAGRSLVRGNVDAPLAGTGSDQGAGS